MSWLNSTLEAAGGAIDVDVTGVGLVAEDGKPVEVLSAKPLSAAEYQALKSEPEIRTLSGDDRSELLAIRMTFEMLKKCDSSLKWGEFRRLPLALVGELSSRIAAAIGAPSGGGVLGEA